MLFRSLEKRLGVADLQDNRVVFHYLDGKVDAEIYLASQQPIEEADRLQARCAKLVRDDELFRVIHVHHSRAQK